MTAPMQPRIVLRRRPAGPLEPGDFAREDAPEPAPEPGRLVLDNRFLSIDPAIRQWIGGRGRYIPPIAPGGAVRAVVLGRVRSSGIDGFASGDWVRALGAWEAVSSVGPRDFPMRVEPVEGLPLRYHLGVLGSTGLAAWFGLHETGRPKPGETVLVSAAAGAVGSIVCQLARMAGCRVAGAAGGPEKCAWIQDRLGCDAAIDYRAGGLRDALAAACPGGVDLYFDNTGGPLLEAALGRLNRGGRVVLCGATAQYDRPGPPAGPANYLALLECGGRMEGFLLAHYAHRFAEGIAALAPMLRDGRLYAGETLLDGIGAAPTALCDLLHGHHRGKVLVRI